MQISLVGVESYQATEPSNKSVEREKDSPVVIGENSQHSSDVSKKDQDVTETSHAEEEKDFLTMLQHSEENVEKSTDKKALAYAEFAEHQEKSSSPDLNIMHAIHESLIVSEQKFETMDDGMDSILEINSLIRKNIKILSDESDEKAHTSVVFSEKVDLLVQEKIHAYDPYSLIDNKLFLPLDDDLDVESESNIDSLLMKLNKLPVEQRSTNDLALLKSQRIRQTLDGQKIDEMTNTLPADREMILIVNNMRGDGSASQKLPLSDKIDIQQAVREAMINGGNMEVVKRAQFVVRGEQSGEIRLTLRPEHLGTVRINLSMEDGRILGRIVVANADVKEAFAENMRDLRDSFLKNGFESAFDLEHQGESDSHKQKDGGYHSQRLRQSQEQEQQVGDILAYWQTNGEGK